MVASGSVAWGHLRVVDRLLTFRQNRVGQRVASEYGYRGPRSSDWRIL